jgi:hypothetical protein
MTTTYADQVIVRNAAVVLSEIQDYAERNPAFAKCSAASRRPAANQSSDLPLRWASLRSRCCAKSARRACASPQSLTLRTFARGEGHAGDHRYLASDVDTEPPPPVDDGSCDPLYGQRMDSADCGEN